MTDMNTPVKNLPGIGPRRAESLSRLGIETVGGLVRHFPRAYQHRGNIRKLAELTDGDTAALMLTVATPPRSTAVKNRILLTKFAACDDSGRCMVTFFNQRYVSDIFTVGAVFRFWGRVKIMRGVVSLNSPAFESYTEGKVLPEFTPLYPLTEGLTQKIVYSTVTAGISRLKATGDLADPLPPSVREKFGLLGLGEALDAIHCPDNYEMLNMGRKRFIFEELFTFAAGIALSKLIREREPGPEMSALTPDGRRRLDFFESILPFKLTGAQRRTIFEIERDMTRKSEKSGGFSAMARMVSGDVGSGKTVVAAAAAYLAAQNGWQSALMVPTEILAQQHYADLKPLFYKLGLETRLLTGSLKAAERREAVADILSGEVDLVIGTHAILSEDVKFSRLGLVVTDEQHRFGVRQRAALSRKGEDDGISPHVMVMSATPIPRTLAMILWGDLDVSAIDELPPGRQRVGTFVVDESYRLRMNGFIRMQIWAGRQVYVVCPAVDGGAEEGEPPDEGDIVPFDYGYDAEEVMAGEPKLKSAVEFAEKLRTEDFDDMKVGFIHGKMKSAEKEKVMRDFMDNEINILVATTVIEVGVNNPNATMMIVENAERFGLSQLHQLRGRVGRGSHKSYCILVSDTKNEKARKRLNAMRSTASGFKIAEYDLEQRGPGDFFPSLTGEARQHGGLKFKLAALCSDMDTLNNAFNAAKQIVTSDPNLQNPEHAALRREVSRLFSN